MKTIDLLKTFKYFLLIVFFIYLHSCAAPYRITKNSVTIYNQSGQDLTILFGPNDKKILHVIIRDNETWLGPDAGNQPVIKIVTNEKTKTYTLSPGKSYKLYWNAQEKYYDMIEINVVN